MNTVDIKGKSNGDKMAYPVSETQHTGFGPWHEKIYTTVVDGGLTKREMFAMAAMQGILSGFTDGDKANGCYIPECEYPMLMSQAVQLADELLKQLES